MKKRKCILCGKEYQPKRENQKYCSHDCSAKGKREFMRLWRKRNPNYYKDYMKAYRDRKAIY
jgi:predicted nucleic acid-binding Zn ribbon protein